MISPTSPDPIHEEEEEKRLTIKQAVFIDRYIEHGNGALAARQAGYSEQTARAIASENLTKPYMIDAITKRRTELMADSEDKLARYLRQLENEADTADRAGDRIRSLELLVKAHGGFIERSESVVYNGNFLADLDLDEPEDSAAGDDFSSENKDLH